MISVQFACYFMFFIHSLLPRACHVFIPVPSFCFQHNYSKNGNDNSANFGPIFSIKICMLHIFLFLIIAHSFNDCHWLWLWHFERITNNTNRYAVCLYVYATPNTRVCVCFSICNPISNIQSAVGSIYYPKIPI